MQIFLRETYCSFKLKLAEIAVWLRASLVLKDTMAAHLYKMQIHIMVVSGIFDVLSKDVLK